MEQQSTHWADITADKIIREHGEKDIYTCASGITPSGTVHIGNFREIISVDLVVRALREKGKNVRFIYSWDDYDVFRKVPKNMPDQEELEKWLRKPITSVPDPYGKTESYARFNEVSVEEVLPSVGVRPEYIFQAKRYLSSYYSKEIRRALEKKDEIRAILDEHRTVPLDKNWMPVSVFCEDCGRDTTSVTDWDGAWTVSYLCESCGRKGSPDLRSTGCVKLPWRVDWPMRWSFEGVDFEPAGKEHHSSGGSFDTASQIVTVVYDAQPPVTFKYDFITLKGRGGKISSSSGDVISLTDVLEIYTPEVTRFLFAGTRPNTEFSISFDLDVLKIYEDYDSCERLYFSKPDSEKARRKKEKNDRIYELSQIDSVPSVMPYQIPIRHLCNLLQIFSGDIDAVIASLGDVSEVQVKRFREKAVCAWNWITSFAPEDFRFALAGQSSSPVNVSGNERDALRALNEMVMGLESLDEKAVAQEIYAIAEKKGMDSGAFFTLVYRVLIGKEKGPRLASFLKTIGKQKITAILSRY